MAQLLKNAQGSNKKKDDKKEGEDDELKTEGIHPAILLLVLSILYLVLLLMVEFIDF